MRTEDPKVAKKKRVRVLAEHKPLGDSGDRDNAFVAEAEKLKKYYGDDVDFELLPFYGQDEFNKIDLSNTQDTDEVYLFGHKGSKLGGVDHTEIADRLQKSGVKNCYMGSCSMEQYSEPYKKLQNFMYRPEGSWYGVNPKGKNVEEVMYSKSWTGNPKDFYGADIVDPQLGKDYNKIFNRPKPIEPINVPARGIPSMKNGGKLKYNTGGIMDLLSKSMAGGQGNPFSMIASLGASLIPTTNSSGRISKGGMAASSALQGAGIGATFGPLGAGIGAGLGAGVGLLTAVKQQREQDERMNIERGLDKRRNSIASRAILSNYATNGVESSGYYKNGGKFGSDVDDLLMSGGKMQPIAEDVSIAKGKSHEQGGINLYDKDLSNFAEIEDNEVIKEDKVYSDSLEVPNFLLHSLGLHKNKKQKKRYANVF